MNQTLFKYITKKFAFLFLAVLFLLAFVVLLFDVIELVRSSAKSDLKIAFSSLLILGLFKAPQMVHLMLPFVALLSAIIFLFQMTRSSELIVMRAVGLSVWNFIAPLIFVTFLIGIINITIFNPISAWTSRQYERMEEKYGITSKSPFSFSEDGLWLRENHDDGALVLRADRVQADLTGLVTLENPVVLKLNPNETLQSFIKSDIGILQNKQVILENAFVLKENQEASHIVPQIIFPTEFTLERILERFDEPETMSFWRFPSFIHFLKSAGFSTTQHNMYWHSLLAFPLFLTTMMFIGITFSLPQTTRQSRFLFRLILAILFGFLFYFFNRITTVLGISQSLPYLLAAWAPSFIVLPLCISALLHLEDG